MVFEKKVIIGSIMSFVATAVGVIAIFFPDLFNLQKEKMEKIELTINTRQDIDVFTKFVADREKDGKIFEADITLPYLDDDKERSNEYFSIEAHTSKSELFGYTFNANDVWGDDKLFSIDVADTDKDNLDFDSDLGCVKSMDDWCDLTSYKFPSKRIQSREVINGGARIRGYFSVDKEKTGGDATANWVYFQDIPKEQIQLKNY